MPWNKKAENKRKKFKDYSREEKIDKMLEEEVTQYSEDTGNIADILRYGFKGYEKMSDEELNEAFEPYLESEAEGYYDDVEENK